MDNLIVAHDLPIQKALEIIDSSYTKTLFVVSPGNVLAGTLTDGDVRRWILRTGDIRGTVMEACHRDPFVLYHPADRQEALAIMQKLQLEAAPVVDTEGRITSLLVLSELLEKPALAERGLTETPVVIMAGGKGTRLDPFTRILPKPLIPIGQQPVIEHIMQQFAHYGADTFHITLNHKAGLIKAYFEDQQYPYHIHFIEEQKPLGTAGALALLSGHLKGSFFVSNCDVLLHSDCNEMLRFHREKGFALTMITALHHQSIPYGVCAADEEGNLISLTEKPRYPMLVNTGIYVMESDILSMIPGGRMHHITDLIADLQRAHHPVGVFPVPAGAYHDIGQWNEYRNTLSHLSGGEVYPSAYKEHK
jgi:dTDP-glucose pyrophosphorylase